MTTISVKFRQSTVKGKAGTAFCQVVHNRRMARINTDIHVLPCEWNEGLWKYSRQQWGIDVYPL